MANEAKLDWHTIEADECSDETAALMAEWKALNERANIVKKKFEANYSDDYGDVPDGKKLVFGYYWGKPSIALVKDDGKRPTGKPKQTLAQWKAAQSANGRAY